MAKGPAKHHRLVVDDHEDSLDLLARYITRATQGRCRVIKASDPKEAIAIMAKGQVDLVFSDICMPEIDGIRLAQVAKAQNPNLKVVLTTAYQEYFSEEETRRLGADAYLPKPLDFATIRDIVDQLSVLI